MTIALRCRRILSRFGLPPRGRRRSGGALLAATLACSAGAQPALSALWAPSLSTSSGLPAAAHAASAASLRATSPSPPQAQGFACPTSPSTASGRDFRGQKLDFVNFSRLDLTNANFQGATLKGAVFIGANLTGANFSNAKFVDTGSPARTTDFSFATLQNACFIGASFAASTYFTYATLTCADFSLTDISTGNAIFGDEPLRYAPPSDTGCRTSFRRAAMNCEFMGDWKNFDLSDAVVVACRQELADHDFSGAMMAGLNFASMVLDGSNFAGANLMRAVFTGASLQCVGTGAAKQCVDLSKAQLQGANLSKANLTGANMAGAFLSSDIKANQPYAASLTGAHLKNVNLANAQLSGVDFSYANFFSSGPANPSGCSSSAAGFTASCASAFGATMLGTNFTRAFLYGVDFGNAGIAGVLFDGAVLVGASFAGATIGTDTNSATRTSFLQAYLQGTNLDLAASIEADLTDAFLDFNGRGNTMNILLDGRHHNAFPCPGVGCNPPTVADVCVRAHYPTTTVPVLNTLITCPDGGAAGAGGCGPARASGDPAGPSRRWASSLDIGKTSDLPPAWYVNDATYTARTSPADPVFCGGPANPSVFSW